VKNYLEVTLHNVQSRVVVNTIMDSETQGTEPNDCQLFRLGTVLDVYQFYIGEHVRYWRNVSNKSGCNFWHESAQARPQP
jgi:hypothetical protein